MSGKSSRLPGASVGSPESASCDEAGGKKVDNMDSYCRIEPGLEMGQVFSGVFLNCLNFHSLMTDIGIQKRLSCLFVHCVPLMLAGFESFQSFDFGLLPGDPKFAFSCKVVPGQMKGIVVLYLRFYFPMILLRLHSYHGRRLAQ